MKVWIDQDLCTGDGLCAEISPTVFELRDGISYVRAPGAEPSWRGGPGDLVHIAEAQLDATLEAAEECPGECIFIEN